MPHTDANRPVIADWGFPQRGAVRLCVTGILNSQRVGLPWRGSVHLFDLLAEWKNPRRAEGKLCLLPQVVLFAILAIAAGANSYRTARQKLAQAMTFLAASIVVRMCSGRPSSGSTSSPITGCIHADIRPASYLTATGPSGH